MAGGPGLPCPGAPCGAGSRSGARLRSKDHDPTDMRLARGVGCAPGERQRLLNPGMLPLDQLKRDAITQAADWGPEALEGF